MSSDVLTVDPELSDVSRGRYNTPKRREAARYRWQTPPQSGLIPGDGGESSPLAVTSVCDRAAAVLESGTQGEVSEILAFFGSYLRWLRRQSGEEGWRDALNLVLKHRLSELMLLDPFTALARQSEWPIMSTPEILDFIYGGGRSTKSLAGASAIGRAIFIFNHGTRRSRAIRQQRATVAELLAESLCAQKSLRIAALGCGYLRELYSIAWSANLSVDLFLAADRDCAITASVRRQGFHPLLKTLSGPPAKLARFGLGSDGFHLIYSLNFLDTLDDVIAGKLIARMAEHLAPGGRLFLANSLPDTPDACFQEVLLGQRVFARTQSDLALLVRPLKAVSGLQIHLAEDHHGEFANLTLSRL